MSNIFLYFRVDSYTFGRIIIPIDDFVKRTMMCVDGGSEIHGLWCYSCHNILSQAS